MEVLSKRLEIVVLISIKSYSKQMIMIKNKNLASLEAHIQEEDEQSARLATEKLEKMKKPNVK